LAGRPRSWLNEYDFVQEYRLLIPRPPRCFCGAHNYRYGKVNLNVYAACNDCDEKWVFIRSKNKWLPMRFYS